MSHFSIAAMQLALKSGDNLAFIEQQIVDTVQRYPWINMVVLTELCSYGANKTFAEQLPGKAEIFYCNLAKKQNIWIITGSMYEKVGDELYNCSSVINNQGEVVSRYRKIFPFYPYESGVNPGTDFVVFDVPEGRIGLAICYDLWFPEVARTLACMGAEIIIYPTMTGTIDRELEVLMTQSTAIVNQCYALSINAVGEQGNGQSIIVGPEGDVIYKAGSQQEIIPIELDFERVRRSRERGIKGLGQPLKSFRDNEIKFTAYENNSEKNNNLNKLGPLIKPNNENIIS